MSEKEYIPYRKIPSRLRINAGDVVLLTSDLLRLAIISRKEEKHFDTDAFIDAFTEALGPGGTMLIPSYNFDLENGDAYSVRETEPMTGSLAMAAMRRSDFVRTYNPLHSFMVWGQDALLLAAMKNESSFGPDSPFAYLYKKDALMVFAGTSPAAAMTFTHYVEESLQVGYRKFRTINLMYTDAMGETTWRKFKLYGKKRGYTMMLQRLEGKLRPDILVREEINGIAFSMIRCGDSYEAISKDITENHAAAIAAFSPGLYLRDIIKDALRRFNIFRTTYGKIRSGKRIS